MLTAVKNLIFPNPSRGFNQSFDLGRIATKPNTSKGKVLVRMEAVPGVNSAANKNGDIFLKIALEGSDNDADFYPLGNRNGMAIAREISIFDAGIEAQAFEFDLPQDAPRFVRVAAIAPTIVKIPAAQCTFHPADPSVLGLLKVGDDIEKLRSDFEDKQAQLELESKVCNQFICFRDRLGEAQKTFLIIKERVEAYAATPVKDFGASLLIESRSIAGIGQEIAAREAVKQNLPAILADLKAKTVGEASSELDAITAANRPILEKFGLL